MGLEAEAQGLVHEDHELYHVGLVDVEDVLFGAVLGPLFLELLCQIGEVLDGVVEVDVVLLEALHEHEDEEVEHDELLQDDEDHEEQHGHACVKMLPLPQELFSMQPNAALRVVSNMIMYQSSPVEHLNSVRNEFWKFWKSTKDCTPMIWLSESRSTCLQL